MGKCDAHGHVACSRCVVVGEAAFRMADTVNLMMVFRDWDELIRSCMAFRLDDGTTDNVLYPDRKTALLYQIRPACVFYFRNSMGGINAKDAQIFLDINREAYESDRVAWVDPESPDLIISTESGSYMRRNPMNKG